MRQAPFNHWEWYQGPALSAASGDHVLRVEVIFRPAYKDNGDHHVVVARWSSGVGEALVSHYDPGIANVLADEYREWYAEKGLMRRG